MPNDKMVTGKVSKTKNGFTKAFKNDNTTANTIAWRYPSTATPGKSQAAINSARLEIIILKKKFIPQIK